MNKKSFQSNSIPARLGIAADLTFSVRDPLGYLADCLLVHEEVVVPLSSQTLRWLEGVFDRASLELLIKENRLRFCPSYSLGYANKNPPPVYDRNFFIAGIKANDFGWVGNGGDSLFREIERNFIDSSVSSYDAWLHLRSDVDDAFAHFSGRQGYEFLFPPSQPFYYQTGAITGVARMHDLLAVGITDFAMDEELPFLLEICLPIKKEKGISEEIELGKAKKVIQDLHKIKNLPSFENNKAGLHRPQSEVDRIVRVVLSDEAQNLRNWLSRNLTPDLDVRAAYDKTEKLLPSKAAWSKWTRFGVSTGLSTVAGALVAGPVGAIVGAAVCAADLVAGEKVTAMLDDYHPRMWLSHIQSTEILKDLDDSPLLKDS